LLVGHHPHRRLVGGAGGQDHRLVAQFSVGGDPRVARHQQLGASDKEDRRESDQFLRSKLAVVEPHSRLISPLRTAAIPVSAVTLRYLTAISSPSSSAVTSTTALHKSIE
jgi:hypothetical protein